MFSFFFIYTFFQRFLPPTVSSHPAKPQSPFVVPPSSPGPSPPATLCSPPRRSRGHVSAEHMASASPVDVTRSSPTHDGAAPPHCGERVGAAGEGRGATRRQQHLPLLPWQHQRGISPLSFSPSHRRQTSSPLLPCHSLVLPPPPNFIHLTAPSVLPSSCTSPLVSNTCLA